MLATLSRWGRNDMALAKPKPVSASTAGIEQPWREQNLGVVSLGFAWIAALLSENRDASAAETATAYQDARTRMRDAGMPAAIDRLSLRFRLAPFDEDLLLLALSSQLHGRPDRVTMQVARDVYGITRDDAAARLWDRLAPAGRLRQFRLMEEPEHPLLPGSPLFIDERVGRYLMGEDLPDPRISGMVNPANGGPCPRRHIAGIERLMRRLHASPRPVAMIVGPKNSGRRAAATVLANSFGLKLAELNPRPLEASPGLLAVLAREAILGGYALVVDVEQPEGKRFIEERLWRFDGLVLAIAEARHEFSFELPVTRLEALEPEDRVQLWRDALGPDAAALGDAIAAVAMQFKFGPRTIAAAAREGSDLWREARDRASREIDALADRLVPHYTWDDIVLPDDVVQDLKAAAAQVRHQTRVYGDYGFARKYPRARGISMLLSGPSGAGKTMAAEVIANDLGLDLYRIDLSRVVSKYIGETEKNLRAVFEAAEASGAVLLFDEADALFGKRSEVKDSHDRYANIEVSYLLQRMESYAGLAILATNMKSHLDAAFLRRLRYVVDVPFPDATARRLIWQKSIPAEMPCAGLDFDALARLDIAGGNIAIIVVNAAFLAAEEGRPLTMRHLTQAARAEYRKLDRELRLNWPGAL
jgi:ATP-dependent 26S proteasome regulatory subunit